MATATFRPVNLSQLREEQLRVHDLQTRHAGYNAVVLLHDTAISHRATPNRWQVVNDFTVRVLVLNPRAREYTTFTRTLPKGQELTGLSIVILRPDGSVTTLGKQDLIVSRQTDKETTYKLVFPRIVAGTLIEERVQLHTPRAEQIGFAYSGHRISTQFTVPAEHVRVRYSFPKSWGISIKRLSRFFHEHLKHGRLDDTNWVVAYDRKNVLPVSKEPDAGYFLQDAHHLYLQLGKFLGRTGLRTMFTTWKQIASAQNNHSAAWEQHPKLLHQAVQRIIASKPSLIQRMTAVIRFLQRRVREQTQGGFPKTYYQLLKTGAGSRLMITMLAQRMLHYAGVSASTVLIHDARDGPFDKTFVRSNEVTVPALALQTRHKWLWIFPYLRHQPIGLIPPYVQGQMGVLLHGNRRGELLETGTHGPNLSLFSARSRLQILANGQVRLEHRHERRGMTAVKLRGRLLRYNAKQLKKAALYWARHEAAPLSRLNQARILNLEDLQKPLVLTYRGVLKRHVTRDGDEAVLHLPRSFGVVPAQKSRRLRPVTTNYAKRLKQIWEIRVPATWRLFKPPPNDLRKNRFGRFLFDVRQSGDLVVVRQILTYKRTRQPASRYKELCWLEDGVRRVRSVKLVFRIQK